MKAVPSERRRPSLIPPALASAIRGCVAGNEPWPLFVHGSVGTGKTSAALALSDHVDCSLRYYEFVAWCREYQDASLGRLVWHGTHDSTQVTTTMLVEHFGRGGLCILDDFGVRDRVSDMVYEATKSAIDSRYGKPLLVLSNLDLAAIGKLFDDRISSRLSSGTVCLLTGSDRRQQ